jgi:putative FmdB family regulatory protein
MPIYVYRNLATGETFELEQRISDAALSAHPETGEPVKRLIQPVAVAFKGPGFYVTDSRKDTGSSKPKGSDGVEGKAESKAEAKPEKKPESKTAAAND